MKKVRLWSLALVSILCLSLLSGCANPTDGFDSSEVVDKITFSNGEVNCYKAETLFKDKAWEDGTSKAVLWIVDNIEGTNNYDYWKYFIQYQVNFSTAADQAESPDKYSGWAVRRVYCKNRKDALSAFSEIRENYDPKIQIYTSFSQYYGIDYDVISLMKTPALSLSVNNMDGD